MPEDPNNSTGDRATRSAEPYRLPSSVVGATGDADLDSILSGIKQAGEMEIELNFKSLDGHLTNSDRVIANAAAMKQMNSDPIELLERLAKVNFTA